MSLEARLQAATSDYQKIQSDLATAVDARQRLGAQLTESEMVKKVHSVIVAAVVHAYVLCVYVLAAAS
jgi:prefoldin beta subunit